MPIICSIAMRFPLEHITAAEHVLLSVVGPTRSKRECLACRVSRDVEDPESFHYLEYWASIDVMKKHFVSEDFLKVLITMDLCCEEPRIIVAETMASGGVQTLSEFRGPTRGRDSSIHAD